MTTSQVQQESAFEALAEVAAEFYERGRGAHAATIKPALVSHTQGRFNEFTLGYANFRQFVRAAAAAGVIDIHPAQRGPDIVIVPPGKTPRADGPPAGVRGGGLRLRHDLWRAFVDWTPGYWRLYDREHDRVERIPRMPVESLEGVRRELVEAAERGDNTRAVEIEPISTEQQLEWMVQFADQAGPSGLRLQAALRSERPAQNFIAALRYHRELQFRWRQTLFAHVKAAVEAWTEKNGLEIAIIERPREPEYAPDAEPTKTGPPRGRETERLDELRRLVHRAVDRMSVAELEDLRIPVRYFHRD